MSLVECRTADDVIALARARREWRKRMYEPRPVKVVIVDQTPAPEPIAVTISAPEPFIPPEPLIPYANKRVAIIKAAVGRAYGVDRIQLDSKCRTAAIVRPRQVAMYLAKTMTLHTLPEIGRRFGGRDHTTVLHAVRKIAALRINDTDLDAKITEIEQTIRGDI
jgi:hypothetical protein